MADDAAGLLSELELAPAHVIGASMGGMIAQTLAARHPRQLRSLVSIMSNTGSLWSGRPKPKIFPLLLRDLRRGRDAFISARGARIRRRSARPAFPATPTISARSPP